ncbi:MAG TPA: DUF3885 domain-containing protein [Caulobacteraceae bacterium]|jgi:hypothetical protein
MNAYPTPIDRILGAFGWSGFPDAMFYEAVHGLRFDLGGDLPMGPVRSLRAIDRARTVAEAVFEGSVQVTGVVGHYSGERRSRSAFASFMRLRDVGFNYPFGPPEKAPQAEGHVAEFGEDLCRCWHAADFSNNRAELSALLWTSVAREMRVTPKARWLDVYIVDFDRGLVLRAYDNRGMDVVATQPGLFEQVCRTFDAWLLDHDRAVMDEEFR